MSNWIKVENDAPAVLRALADGKKARYDSWEEGEWVQLGNDGAFCDEGGNRLTFYTDLSGTWFIERRRDIAQRPQAGDEFMSGSSKCRVRFVHDGVVVFAEDDDLYADPLALWTKLWADGINTRAK